MQLKKYTLEKNFNLGHNLLAIYSGLVQVQLPIVKCEKIDIYYKILQEQVALQFISRFKTHKSHNLRKLEKS